MKFKLLLGLLILPLLIPVSLASIGSIVWKGTYHQGIPNRNNISNKYCEDHTPGTNERV